MAKGKSIKARGELPGYRIHADLMPRRKMSPDVSLETTVLQPQDLWGRRGNIENMHWVR